MKIIFTGTALASLFIGEVYDDELGGPAPTTFTVTWEVTPVSNEVNTELLFEADTRLKEDIQGWITNHVDGKIATEQDNVDMDKYFIMDHAPTIANFPLYLLEMIRIRARPFGFELTELYVYVKGHQMVYQL